MGFARLLLVITASWLGLCGSKGPEFRDRYGDWGRDLVLYLGRKDCGLKLRELGEHLPQLERPPMRHINETIQNGLLLLKVPYSGST
jgi:hypothetical protein